jgi:hypothetical protein
VVGAPSLIAHSAGMGALTRSHTPLPERPPPCRGTLPSDRPRPSCGPSRPSSPPTVPTSVTSRLDMDWDGHVAIIWEEGPYEWTYHFGTDDVDEELTIEVQEFQPGAVVRLRPVTMPKGVFVEPYTTFALGIYPD